MADLFSTDVMNAVVADLKGDSQFLVDRYFGSIQTEASEEIHFDVLDGKRRIAPFVSPLVEGQIVASLGWKTFTLKPAYIKDKRVFDMNKPLKRSPGEPMGGNMSPGNRLRALISIEMRDQLTMLNRRLEVMAGEILTTGKCTIAGDKYPTVVVDFGRAVGNTIVAAPLWSDPNAKPLTDLQTWSTATLKSTGVAVTDLLMSLDAWLAFSSNDQVTGKLNLYRELGSAPSLSGDAQTQEGGVYYGNIDGFNIYVYNAWYVDPIDGVEKPIIPAGTVIMTSPALNGVQCYGAIRDEEAGLQPVAYYVKSWVEPDPSVRFVMLQSAPLLVPTRPNASVKIKVL
jgi:hypothetical protein